MLNLQACASMTRTLIKFRLHQLSHLWLAFIWRASLQCSGGLEWNKIWSLCSFLSYDKHSPIKNKHGHCVWDSQKWNEAEIIDRCFILCAIRNSTLLIMWCECQHYWVYYVETINLGKISFSPMDHFLFDTLVIMILIYLHLIKDRLTILL